MGMSLAGNASRAFYHGIIDGACDLTIRFRESPSSKVNTGKPYGMSDVGR